MKHFCVKKRWKETESETSELAQIYELDININVQHKEK